MCGIVGFTGGGDGRLETVRAMAERIAHRGPDSFGEYVDEHIALGFRSLAFLDIGNGKQPMTSEDGNYVIVFNGEIYNHSSLREEIIKLGRQFSTGTDTEVLLHLYAIYGEKMLTHLRGMFAFVIYDTKKRTIFAARDPFGIKPFYYTRLRDNNLFAFSSEIKAFLDHPLFVKEVNNQALENYLTFQYSVLGESFFKGVYKLQPGHSLHISLDDGEIHISQYFEKKFNPDNSMNMEEAVVAIDEAVSNSVHLHRQADVELASFLSGGVDSSYVAACFGGQTFSVGFDNDGYNETQEAAALAKSLGIANEGRIITAQEFWEAFPKVQYYMDEPLADASAVALYFVSELARRHVKGVMSGEGADELFGGYNIYREPLDIAPITSLPLWLRRLLAKCARLLPTGTRGRSLFIRAATPLEERFIGNANIFSYEERMSLLKNPTGNFKPQELTRPFYEASKAYDDTTRMQHLDIHMWLVGDILLKADTMSMAHSLELRVPLLDAKVFEIASRLPSHLRTTKQGTKLAFRKAALRRLPDEVAKRRKLGFPVPIRLWLAQDEYANKLAEAFESPSSAKFFHQDKLLKMLEEHRKGKADNSRKLWCVYSFLVWHDQFFGDA